MARDPFMSSLVLVAWVCQFLYTDTRSRDTLVSEYACLSGISSLESSDCLCVLWSEGRGAFGGAESDDSAVGSGSCMRFAYSSALDGALMYGCFGAVCYC